jgi:hypothetical protein
MATDELRSQARSLHPLIRRASLTGIALLVATRLTRAVSPNLLPSSSWRPEFCWLGVTIAATFELLLLVLLLGVPYCIFRSRYASARDLLLDFAAAVSLYLATLLLL